MAVHHSPLRYYRTPPMFLDPFAPLNGDKDSFAKIRDTNLSPNELQHQQIAWAVSTGESLLDSMNQEMQVLLAGLVRVLEERLNLTEKIAPYKKSLSVVRQIPTGIWERVIEFCIDNPYVTSTDKSCSPIELIIYNATMRKNLAAVCSGWRNILKNSANIWGSGVWGIGRYSQRSIEWPLTDPELSDHESSFYVPSSPWFAYTDGELADFPLKECITFPWTVAPPWSRVEKFYLNTTSGDRVLKTLEACPEITTLVLETTNCVPSFVLGRTIVHSNITSIAVANPAILQPLSLPSLTNIIVGPSEADRAILTDGLAVLKNFFERNECSKMETLDIKRLPVVDDTLLNILKVLPQLSAFRLEVDTLDKAADQMIGKLIELLTYDGEDFEKTLSFLPNLQVLYLQCEDPTNRATFITDKIAKMIGSRWGAWERKNSLLEVHIGLLRFQDFAPITSEEWRLLQGLRAEGLEMYMGSSDGLWNWFDIIKGAGDADWDAEVDDDDEY